KQLMQNEKSRGRSVNLLLLDSFRRIDEARRDILVDKSGRRRWNIDEKKLNDMIMRRLPDINKLALHYYNPEKITKEYMQSLHDSNETRIPVKYFLDAKLSPRPSTTRALWVFCMEKAKLVGL